VKILKFGDLSAGLLGEGIEKKQTNFAEEVAAN
jgi:translation elongation factor EF-Ts